MSDTDVTLQMMSFAVGAAAIPFAIVQPDRFVRYAAFVWLGAWCGPPLLRLWFATVLM